jgi:type IV secretion system protein VirB5
MKALKRLLSSVFLLGALLGSQAANAGIPVIDAANLTQAIQQVVAWSQQYEQMVQSIQQLENQYNQAVQQYQSLTGIRGLGDILNNPALQQVVPPDVANVYSSINNGGFSGLTSAAKSLRNATAIYNCEDRTGQDQTLCQAALDSNSQAQAYQQNALALLTQRVSQVQSLMDQINTTQDPKAIAELQARLQAENTQVTNDSNRVALMQQMAQAQQAAADQALRERWLRAYSSTAVGSEQGFEFTPPN